MRFLRETSIVLLAVWFLSCTGCGRKESGSPGLPRSTVPALPGASAVSVETYKLTGVVREVDAHRGSVTIRHDAIPGFMEAMTMPFTVKDHSDLDDVRPGDEVEGTLRVKKAGGEVQDYDLEGLVVSRPAPAPSLVLSLPADGGAATVSAATKEIEPGELVPDFSMITQDGSPRKLSDDRGKTVVLTFIYTRCPLPDFCPAVDRKFAILADRLRSVPRRAAEVRLLSVSFDPEHDTPEVLRKHAAMRGALPPLWTFAVASHAELAKVAGALGLKYGPAPGEIIHSLSTAVIDPEGRLLRLDAGKAGKAWTPDDLLKAIRPPKPGA